MVLFCSQTFGQPVVAPEDKVKAAFLYNFAKLVDWPTNVLAQPREPLVIGVLGRDPFGSVLEDTVHRKEVNGHEIQIKRYDQVAQATNCQVLFISESEYHKTDSIFNELQGKPVLTVADAKAYDDKVMILLFKSEDRIQFKINLPATRESGLRLSSRLLRLDRSLHPGHAQPEDSENKTAP